MVEKMEWYGVNGLIPKYAGGRPSKLSREDLESLDKILLRTPNVSNDIIFDKPLRGVPVLSCLREVIDQLSFFQWFPKLLVSPAISMMILDEYFKFELRENP